MARGNSVHRPRRGKIPRSWLPLVHEAVAHKPLECKPNAFSRQLVVLLLHQPNDVAVLDHWWYQIVRQIDDRLQDCQQEGKARTLSFNARCGASLILHPAQLAPEQAYDVGT